MFTSFQLKSVLGLEPVQFEVQSYGCARHTAPIELHLCSVV